jgi:capsular exopolysaccharide synthesis family protein
MVTPTQTTPEFAEIVAYSLGLLKRRVWTVLTFFTVTLLVVLVGTAVQPATYRTTATVLIDMEAPNVLTVSASRDDSTVGQTNYLTYADYYRTQLEIIKSRRIAQRVLLNLGLDERAPYAEAKDPVEVLLDQVTVEPVKQTRLVKLHVQDSSPTQAAKIANEFAIVFVEENLARTALSESLTLMKNEYLKLQSKEAELSKRYKPMFPVLIRLRQQMKELASAIEKELEKQLSDQRLQDAGGEPGETKTVLERLQESSMIGGLRPNNIRLQDLAQVPRKRASPTWRLNLVLGLLIGFLGGIGAAVAEEFPNGTVRVPKDIEQDNRFVLLGYVPRMDAVRKGKEGTNGKKEGYREMQLRPQSLAAESYRAIRTNLLYAVPQNGSRVVAVTSPGSEEGKTTTIANLAISLAQTGASVLLVDADLRKPHLHSILGLAACPGLSEFLVGRADYEDVTRPTEVPNLSLVAAGTRPPNPAELLGQRKMKEFFKRAAENFEWILVDTPPAIPITDAVILAGLTGTVIAVCQSGKTPREALNRTVLMCKDSHAKVLGVILNNVAKVDLPIYGYGPGYYYYGTEGNGKKPNGGMRSLISGWGRKREKPELALKQGGPTSKGPLSSLRTQRTSDAR